MAEILAMGPRLKILVTSRAALHVYGEREYPIAPLALPDKRTILNLEDLAQSPAVALFVQRAVAAKPDFELNKENAAAIAEICARLGWLGLRLDLSANVGNAKRIGAPDSQIDVRVIATDEEQMIARHTLAVTNEAATA